MAKPNQAATTQENAVAIVTEMPEWLKKGSNKGSEDVTGKDMSIPRVDVLQALSPQIKRNDPSYIEGANQGDIFNTITGHIYGNEVTFIPVLFRREFCVWKLRTSGGGFAGAFKTEQEADAARLKLPDPDSYEVSESHQHFALVINGSTIESVVFSMAKSRLKTSRQLNTLVQMAEVDRFAKAYKASAVEVDGPKGTYWSMKVTPMGFVSADLYKKGQELYELINAGAADVDRTGTDAGEPVPSAEL